MRVLKSLEDFFFFLFCNRLRVKQNINCKEKMCFQWWKEKKDNHQSKISVNGKQAAITKQIQEQI